MWNYFWKIRFFAKNHCEIQVCTILVCALYSIKYGTNAKPSVIFLTKCGREAHWGLLLWNCGSWMTFRVQATYGHSERKKNILTNVLSQLKKEVWMEQHFFTFWFITEWATEKVLQWQTASLKINKNGKRCAKAPPS